MLIIPPTRRVKADVPTPGEGAVQQSIVILVEYITAYYYCLISTVVYQYIILYGGGAEARHLPGVLLGRKRGGYVS